MTTPDPFDIHHLVLGREAARLCGDWSEADKKREQLRALGVSLDDRRCSWRRGRTGGRYADSEPMAHGTVPRPPSTKNPTKDRRGARQRKKPPPNAAASASSNTPLPSDGWEQPLLTMQISFSTESPWRVQLTLSVLPLREGPRQSVEGLVRILHTLPCSQIYPELTAQLVPILTQWQRRFSEVVWQRLTKIPQVCGSICVVLRNVLLHRAAPHAVLSRTTLQLGSCFWRPPYPQGMERVLPRHRRGA